jgi:hypothetical protein
MVEFLGLRLNGLVRNEPGVAAAALILRVASPGDVGFVTEWHANRQPVKLHLT